MKSKLIIPALSLMIASSCGGPKDTGIDLKNLNTSVRPQDDFYEYACGGWMKNNPLLAEYARYGTFDQLRENNQKQLNDLIQKLSKSSNESESVQQKIGDLYKMGMDEKVLNEQGNQPIQAELNSIATISTREQVNEELVNLQTQQIHPFFALFGEADFSNSSMCIAWVYQGGLGLGERDYYLETDDRSKEIREKYVEHMAKIFSLSGYDKISKTSADNLAKSVMALETRLAKAAMDKITQRDPQKIFNKVPVSKLEAMAPAMSWNELFEAAKIGDTRELNVAQPEYMKEVSRILQTENIEVLKAYLAWNYINEASSYLSDDFVNQNFEFYEKVLTGREELRPRWKRTVDVVDRVLGEAVGQAYVKEYFSAEAKEKMLKLVKNLELALSDRINDVDWMTNETKEKAQEKLSNFRVKIGYPDKWRDYSGLEVKNDSYWANILRSNKFDFEYLMNEINKPLDQEKWHIFPQTVNAYYNPTTNEICFPAGILQPPFFNVNADDAVNYGAIGVVIGHEMTHGFDDQGRQYDKNGNLKNWWVAEDAKQFDERAKALADYFNKIEVLPGLYANGEYTLGENIADNGGLQVSYLALQKALNGKKVERIDGFTPDQRFFIAYATLWAGNIRDKEIERRTKVDVHSLGRWRVNGTLPHVTAFENAFDVQLGDGMYLAPEGKAQIW
ncbi:MAG: M13 family metallopeptidase [Prevotellaceae bacterium]|jgi:putative endopeptidase|nr:M13 family metallopeptidase [Prevotellaceae bacterium]